MDLNYFSAFEEMGYTLPSKSVGTFPCPRVGIDILMNSGTRIDNQYATMDASNSKVYGFLRSDGFEVDLSNRLADMKPTQLFKLVIDLSGTYMIFEFAYNMAGL